MFWFVTGCSYSIGLTMQACKLYSSWWMFTGNLYFIFVAFSFKKALTIPIKAVQTDQHTYKYLNCYLLFHHCPHPILFTASVDFTQDFHLTMSAFSEVGEFILSPRLAQVWSWRFQSTLKSNLVLLCNIFIPLPHPCTIFTFKTDSIRVENLPPLINSIEKNITSR